MRSRAIHHRADAQSTYWRIIFWTRCGRFPHVAPSVQGRCERWRACSRIRARNPTVRVWWAAAGLLAAARSAPTGSQRLL